MFLTRPRVGILAVTRCPRSAASDLSRLILRSYTSCTITRFFLATIPARSLPLVLLLCARSNPKQTQKQNNASYPDKLHFAQFFTSPQINRTTRNNLVRPVI
jgi:hypothetical protein